MKEDKAYSRFLEIFERNKVLLDADMSMHTSFKAGGKARVMVLPTSRDEVATAIKLCEEETIPLYVIGNGTNLLVRDEGFDGAIIKMGQGIARTQVDRSKAQIRAEAGALLSAVAREAMENSLTGLAFAGGIPGSIGGGTLMNAGAYGGELRDAIKEIVYMTKQGEVKTMPGAEAQFSYRHSIFEERGDIVLESLFQLAEGEKEEIAREMRELAEKRNAKQPVHLPSAGSTFKRPAGGFAGQLIEEAGLKGATIGGAAVSSMHAGFVVNEGGAAAKDIIDLIRLIQYTVFDKSGIMLEPEVKII